MLRSSVVGAQNLIDKTCSYGYPVWPDAYTRDMTPPYLTWVVTTWLIPTVTWDSYCMSYDLTHPYLTWVMLRGCRTQRHNTIFCGCYMWPDSYMCDMTYTYLMWLVWRECRNSIDKRIFSTVRGYRTRSDSFKLETHDAFIDSRLNRLFEHLNIDRHDAIIDSRLDRLWMRLSMNATCHTCRRR